MNEKIQVTQPSMPSYEEFITEIKPLWNSHWLTNMGYYHNVLEKALEKYLEVDKVSLFVNGHMALELVLQAMNLHGEVITTPFTFASTTHAIVRNGLKPVFCDIKQEDCTIDTDKIESLITDKTTAILPVHVYGNICNVEDIAKLSQKYGLKVIYDAAHAFGVKYKNKGVGTFGHASMFSFHATKIFNTIEGGAITFSEQGLEEKLYGLKNFGIKSQEMVDEVGSNAKMNELQAIMGICNLRHIDAEIEKRKLLVEQYRKYLEEIPGIYIPLQKKDIKSNYSYFPIKIDEEVFGTSRDELDNVLRKNNIFARKYFYPLTNSFNCYHGMFDVKEVPNALNISKRILTLPIYADLRLEQVERICKIILSLKK